jgi:membrane-bound lytic murein transglycosylase B
VTAPGAATTTTTTGATTTTLSLVAADRAPNGRAAPRVAATAAGLATQIAATEAALRDPSTPDARRPDLGHLNQLAYRSLSTKPAWDSEVLAALPAELRPVVQAHLRARREFLEMRTSIGDSVPNWEIIEPKPVDTLLGYYKEAEAATGIGWQYLAAINLVETGLGRISGLSTAGAIGPMQFLQSTWNERGIGQGDIRDPHDSILAAARYLVRRGGPADMAKALQGYNNHVNYVRAVTEYAQMFKADERSFRVVYHWEIYYLSSVGDLWLPVGYRQSTAVPVATYLAQAPWSAPAPGGYVPPAPTTTR